MFKIWNPFKKKIYQPTGTKMRKMTFHTILEVAASQKKKEDKIGALREAATPIFLNFLQYCLHPNIKWLVPEKVIPPYRPNPDENMETAMALSTRKLYLFVEGAVNSNPNLNERKRASLFIDLLESVHPDDARLLLSLKDKELPKGLTMEILQEAFPGILE